MKTVQVNDLKMIYHNFASGNFSNVHLISLDNNLYCFKMFKNPYIYPKELVDNICNLTELDFSNDFITPKYVVLQRNTIIGYLSYFNKNNKNIYDLNLKYEDKIKLLKDAKNKLLKLHSEYKIIHGDLNVTNILSTKDLNTSFIDFDSSLRFGESVKTTQSFSNTLINYLKYYDFDYRADIYRFNLSTLKFLNDLKSDGCIIQFLKNGLLDDNKVLKKLNKELLLLPETRKSKYSGKFIIDYI